MTAISPLAAAHGDAGLARLLAEIGACREAADALALCRKALNPHRAGALAGNPRAEFVIRSMAAFLASGNAGEDARTSAGAAGKARGWQEGEGPAQPDTSAWRVFKVTYNGILCSPFRMTNWPSRTLHATCSKGHPADDPACRCGVHAVLDPMDLGAFPVRDWSGRLLPTVRVSVFTRQDTFAASMVVVPVVLHGRLTAPRPEMDPPSTRGAASATLLGPIHIPRWLGAVAEPLHARYGLPVISWHDGIDLREVAQAGSAHEPG